jgi:hypothetical protein
LLLELSGQVVNQSPNASSDCTDASAFPATRDRADQRPCAGAPADDERVRLPRGTIRMLGLGHIPLNPWVLDELATSGPGGYPNRVDLAVPSSL